MGEWRTVQQIAGYEVSNYAQVRDINTGESLNSHVRGSARYVSLGPRGNTKAYRLDEVVAAAFYPGDHTDYKLIHKDDNRHNCNADNLEWVSEALIRARNSHYEGVRIRCIETGEIFESTEDCCKKLGVSKRAIEKCLKYPYLAVTENRYHFEAIE